MIEMFEKMDCKNLHEKFYILTHLYFLKYQKQNSFYEMFQFVYDWKEHDQIK
jgi:hypothetical protein